MYRVSQALVAICASLTIASAQAPAPQQSTQPQEPPPQPPDQQAQPAPPQQAQPPQQQAQPQAPPPPRGGRPARSRQRASDRRPRPPKPNFEASVPDLPSRTVVQAGVGSGIAYASAGVLQLGGAAGLRAGDDSTFLSFTPQIGWFLFNNLQVSALLDLSHEANNDDDDVTTVMLVVEPSYHYPLLDTLFVFAGFGMGASWETEQGSALVAVPRLGIEILIGRSGILTPSVSWVAATQHEVERSNAFRINLGYSVMW